MNVLANSLKNYSIIANEIDLSAAMQRLAELCVGYYAEKGYPPKQKGKVMKELFTDTLKIGTWPAVLNGSHNDIFKEKVVTYLSKVHKNSEKTASAMLQQCKYVMDQLCGERG